MALIQDIKTISDAGYNQYLTSTTYGQQQLISGVDQTKVKADYFSGGTIGQEGIINVGSDRFVLDGKETRQVINDGTTNRILIGKF